MFCNLILVINFLINLYLTYSGVQGKITLGGFFSPENLHNILLIPFFISTMYCWKIFVSVTTTAMPNKNQTLRGALIFFMFILSKTVPTILAILTGNILIYYLKIDRKYWIFLSVVGFQITI